MKIVAWNVETMHAKRHAAKEEENRITVSKMKRVELNLEDMAEKRQQIKNKKNMDKVKKMKMVAYHTKVMHAGRTPTPKRKAGKIELSIV